jgi:hypothetical protein
MYWIPSQNGGKVIGLGERAVIPEIPAESQKSNPNHPTKPSQNSVDVDMT